MKIGLVRRGHSATGGAEAYLLRLADALRGLGHDPVLVTTPDWPTERWGFSGEIVRLQAWSPDAFAAAFRSAKTGCDVHFALERVPGCEVFRAGDGVHAAWLDRRAAFEPVWKRAFRWMNRKHAQLLRLEREVFDPGKTRVVIANSRLVRDEILERFAFPSDRISVVYNGFSRALAPVERMSARAKFGLMDHEFCALFAGSGWKRKGLRVAVDAIEKVPSATLLVAGRGDPIPSSSVKFLGPVRDLATLFAAADIFVLPTWYDPFSNACLEALASGLPVITTTANGFSEIITPGIHGEVIPPGDVSALAAALEAWRAPTRRVAARESCRALAAEFSIGRNAGETLRILESVAQS